MDPSPLTSTCPISTPREEGRMTKIEGSALRPDRLINFPLVGLYDRTKILGQVLTALAGRVQRPDSASLAMKAHRPVMSRPCNSSAVRHIASVRVQLSLDTSCSPKLASTSQIQLDIPSRFKAPKHPRSSDQQQSSNFPPHLSSDRVPVPFAAPRKPLDPGDIFWRETRGPLGLGRHFARACGNDVACDPHLDGTRPSCRHANYDPSEQWPSCAQNPEREVCRGPAEALK